MLESQIDREERKRVLDNDRRVREQGGTFMSHTHSEMGGRFTQVGAAHIVGSTPIPAYPAAAAHQHDPVGQEPPLSYRINDPSDPVEASFFTRQATGEPAAESLAVVGSPLSQPTMAAQRKSQMSSSTGQVDGVRTERPPFRRF
jgi:hypothetical protein